MPFIWIKPEAVRAFLDERGMTPETRLVISPRLIAPHTSAPQRPEPSATDATPGGKPPASDSGRAEPEDG